MKKLTIDWMDLELAFDNSDYWFDYYLDTETGRVLLVTEEARRQLESIYEQFYDVDDDAGFDLTAVLPQTELHDWQQQTVMEAYQVEEDFSFKYLQIPKQDSRDAYQIMENFISTIEDEHLQDHLWRAISGRGAFRYFKDVLSEYPDEVKRWYSYKDARLKEQMRAWLKMEGLEPINEPGTSAPEN